MFKLGDTVIIKKTGKIEDIVDSWIWINGDPYDASELELYTKKKLLKDPNLCRKCNDKLEKGIVGFCNTKGCINDVNSMYTKKKEKKIECKHEYRRIESYLEYGKTIDVFYCIYCLETKEIIRFS